LVAVREWRSVGRWPARTSSVLLAGQVFTAAYPYDLALSTLLATLWALQRKRPSLAVCGIAATLGISPLAFLFLTLILLALFLRQRRLSRQALVAGFAVLVVGGAQLAILAVTPTPGLIYPYGTWRLLAGLGVATLGIAVSLRGRGGWSLASIFSEARGRKARLERAFVVRRNKMEQNGARRRSPVSRWQTRSRCFQRLL